MSLAETPCVDCGSAVITDPAIDGGTPWRCGRCAKTPLAQPVAPPGPLGDMVALYVKSEAEHARRVHTGNVLQCAPCNYLAMQYMRGFDAGYSDRMAQEETPRLRLITEESA